MAMNPRLLRPLASGLRFNPANLVLVFDTSLEPANNTVSVPINNVSGSPNVTIDWGDGTTSTATTNGFVTKTYATPGVKVVQISGTMTRLNYDSGASTTNNKAKLVRCLSFGNLGLTNLENGFRNCPNLIQCPASLPTTSNVFNMNSLFRGCTNFNSPAVLTWNMATVQLPNFMFNGATSFNQPVGGWNTSNFITTANMFSGASAFNQPIGGWDTAQVTNMNGMLNASQFNQDISGWNTGAVTNLSFMFFQNTAFNQPIGSWNVSRVNTVASMFDGATAFSQDISNWDIRKVTTMTSMFSGSTWGTANYDAALEDWADLADADLTIGTTSNTSQAITAFATLSGGTQTRVTSNGHGLVPGSRVNISGTTNYNGDYNVLAAAANTFDIATPFVANDATGTMRHRRSRNITAGFGSNKYNAGAPTTARGVLTSTYDWSITDGGQV